MSARVAAPMAMKELELCSFAGKEKRERVRKLAIAEGRPSRAYPIAWTARMPIRISIVLAIAAAIHPIKDITIEAI